MALERALGTSVPADPLTVARRRPDLSALEERLGHRFADRAGLEEALTHATATAEGARGSYQRLEFLGDRVLGLAVADILAEVFPDASEGDLSRRLAALVRRETCAEVAADWGLGAHLRLGKGAAGSGLRTKPSVLADSCEAVIGAVFRDAGYAAAREVVGRGFAGALARQSSAPPGNPKGQLQEWAAARGLALPVYAVVARSGSDHAPSFRVAVSLQDLDPATGEGSSKQAAMQAAAEALLLREGVLAVEAEAAREGAPA